MQSELWSSSDTQRRRFSRRQLVAAGVLPDTRRAPRFMTIAPAAITAGCDAPQRTALVRDLSATGIFFYSNFKPCPGDALEIVVQLSKGGSDLITLAGNGVVVRLEEAGAGAAFGIAMEVASYELRINGKPVAETNGFAGIAEQLHRRSA